MDINGTLSVTIKYDTQMKLSDEVHSSTSNEVIVSIIVSIKNNHLKIL